MAAEPPAGGRPGLDAGVLILAAMVFFLVLPFLLMGAESAGFVSKPLFDRERISPYVLFVLFSSLVMYAIRRARSGASLYIRPIAGLKAVDEAIGRATEMGRKILYIPGILSMDEIQTIASMAVLGHVARQTAKYGAELDVPNRDALTYTAARETVKQAYIETGREDSYRETIVNYVTYDQWAFTAAVTGRMLRERPAAHFFVGSFYAESLMLSEVGQTTGAIQIAATAEVAQLPFFVCACDYTLIGEEFYAASAYLSREPMLLGSVKGQDWVKSIVLLYLVVAMVAVSGGWPLLVSVLGSK